MKTTPLVLASLISALLGLSHEAQAVHLNPHGIGQVLIFPYYTTRGGNQTLISVVNTTERGKAIRVTFREGRNGRWAKGINLYLAPFDTWTAAVFESPEPQDGRRPAALLTHDNSCTVPQIKNNGALPMLANGARYAPFLNYQYTGPFRDDGPSDTGRTAEGYFELIEMGEVVDRERTSLTDFSPTEASAGVPQNCQRVVDAWDRQGAGGYWFQQSDIDIQAPGGGLYGSAAIVDALNGTMLSYSAEALDAFSSVQLHADPGALMPDLSNAITDVATDSARAQVWLDGAWVELDYPASTQGIDAVSALFAAEALYNDFVTAESAGAASEWVLTFPTKRYYADRGNYSGAPAFPPFVRRFSASGAAAETTFDVWDREGAPLEPEDFTMGSPLTPRHEPMPFCLGLCPGFPAVTPQVLHWATTVLRFNQPTPDSTGTAILGSELSIMVPAGVGNPAYPDEVHLGIHDGRLRVNLYSADGRTEYQQGETTDRHIMRPDRSGRRLLGLPVMGFWAASYTNAAVTPGVLANYSGTTRHRLRQALAPPPAE